MAAPSSLVINILIKPESFGFCQALIFGFLTGILFKASRDELKNI